VLAVSSDRYYILSVIGGWVRDRLEALDNTRYRVLTYFWQRNRQILFNNWGELPERLLKRNMVIFLVYCCWNNSNTVARLSIIASVDYSGEPSDDSVRLIPKEV